MASAVSEYTTRELSEETWPDFQKLFDTHPGPGAYTCQCMYNHLSQPLPANRRLQSGAQRAARNRRQKQALMEQGCAHGILVYTGEEPVGWCQYGSREELPRIENNPAYRKLIPAGEPDKQWRITCFVVHRKYRHRGVASAGLKAALESIRKRGGGTVEAYPITRWGAEADYRGTVSMFEQEGFEIVAPLGKNNVVVRKTL